MPVIDCLQGLVGVTDADCDCFEQPEEWTAATSGLYLGQLLDLNQINAGEDCGQDGIYEVGQAAIDEASLGLQNNILQCWSKANKPRRGFDEYLSQRSATGAITPPGAYAGIAITLRDTVRHGVLHIDGIHTLMGVTGSFNLLVYDNADLLYTVPLTSQANTFKANALAPVISIPFKRDGIDKRTIFLIYQYAGLDPKRNELRCIPCNPSYTKNLNEWGTTQGISGNVLDDRESWSTSNKAYGLIPQIRFECDAVQSICDGGMTIGSDPNVGVISEYIWYMGASKMADKILRSSKINYFTTLPGDELADRRDRYNAEALARLGALCSSQLAIDGGCYTCEKKGGHVSLDF